MGRKNAGHNRGNRWLRVFLALGLALGLCGCHEEAWDPEVAVLVNGRPIGKGAIDRVLEWGFYSDLGQPGERELTIPLVLDKLIDEQLILAEAEKIGLNIDDEHLDRAQTDLGSAWFGSSLPPAELGELRDALRRQLLLRKMTEKIMVERRVLSAGEWRAFWRGWPKNKPPRYLVRVLLLPPVSQTPVFPTRGRQDLEKIADRFEREGMAAIVSGPLWLGGDLLDARARATLEEGLAQKRLAGPIRLEESWAIYEVLEMEPAPKPEDEFRAAQTAFENLAGERAFREWLGELRAGADIRVNPAFNGGA